MFWKQIHILTIYKTLQTQLSKSSSKSLSFFPKLHLEKNDHQTTKTSTYLINYILLKFLPSPEFLLIIPKSYLREQNYQRTTKIHE